MNQRVALVTGAGNGIGEATAIALARIGVTVFVTDIDADAARAVAEKITLSGGNAIDDVLDIREPDEHARIIARAEDELGGLHIAINNAGITLPATPTAELTLEQWELVRSVDLDGVFYGIRTQIPALLRAGGGTIIAVSSLAGVRGLAGMAPYAASKHGVNGLIKTIAWEYGAQGIRALSVGPAFIATGLEDNQPVAVREALPGLHALGRLGQPHEVAEAIAWLSSNAASFLTGAYIPVDGGYLAR